DGESEDRATRFDASPRAAVSRGDDDRGNRRGEGDRSRAGPKVDAWIAAVIVDVRNLASGPVGGVVGVAVARVDVDAGVLHVGAVWMDLADRLDDVDASPGRTGVIARRREDDLAAVG